ncbi:MAG: hypothetical protein ABIC40_03495 [bacterium]
MDPPDLTKSDKSKTGLKKDEIIEDDPLPVLEHFGLLISEDYELTDSIPVHVYRYDDGTVVICSMELNQYAEGDTEYLARRLFSEILIEELEDLEVTVDQGQVLGRDLKIQLSLLRRLLRKIEK